MSFDALSKMSVGAAAGVVAERGGYVDHAISQLSDSYGTTAEAFGLPALPDAGGLVASNAETFRFPTSAAEAADVVAAGLKAARDMLAQALPEGMAMPEALAPQGAGGAAAAGAAARAVAAAGGGAEGETRLARREFLTTGFFLAGAGAAAAVYGFGPEAFKARVDKTRAVARRALHELSVGLDRKLREARAAAVVALETFRSRVSRVLDASRANASRALIAAAPVAADVEAALRRCARDVREAVAPACLALANELEPRVAAAAKAAAARAEAARRALRIAAAALEAAVARALGKDERGE